MIPQIQRDREGTPTHQDITQNLQVSQLCLYKIDKETEKNTLEHLSNSINWSNIIVPYVARFSEKLQRIFSKRDISVHFKPSNTLRQRLVHPRDKVNKTNWTMLWMLSSALKSFLTCILGRLNNCSPGSWYNTYIYIWRIRDSHLRTITDTFLTEKTERMFERWVSEAIHVKIEKNPISRGGGLRDQLSATFNAVLISLPRLFKPASKFAFCGPNNSHDGRPGQWLIIESYLESCDHNNSHECERGHQWITAQNDSLTNYMLLVTLMCTHRGSTTLGEHLQGVMTLPQVKTPYEMFRTVEAFWMRAEMSWKTMSQCLQLKHLGLSWLGFLRTYKNNRETTTEY